MGQAGDSVTELAVVDTNDEVALVAAARTGDSACFEILVSRYERRIFRLAKNITQSHSDAEDVMQEAFLKAFEHLAEFRGNSRFYTWLVRITINQAVMKLRKRRPNQVSLDDPIDTGEDSLPREIEDWGPTPEEQYAQNELAELLSGTIASLPPALRIVFQLRDIENLPTEETANLLGLSVPAVKSRLLRARLELREKLNPFLRTKNTAPGIKVPRLRSLPCESGGTRHARCNPRPPHSVPGCTRKVNEVSLMPPCEIILKARKVVCDGTAAFYFEKPVGFEFKAGQFANFTLLEPAETDAEGNTRTLSIASAPHEDGLMVAMRMRDTAFKRAFDALPVESRVLLQGPYGNLTLHGNVARPAVFLAGGIGITPFRSIIRQATEARSPHEIFLFYSIRRAEEAAFVEELREMECFNPRFKFIPTLTRPDEKKNGWHGQTGHITKEMLEESFKDLRRPIYYVAGPPAMVDAMRQMLNGAGINDDDVRAEEFCGY